MRTVVESRKRAGVASEGRGNESPSCITTTLYGVMAVLQDVVDPDHDRLVVPPWCISCAPGGSHGPGWTAHGGARGGRKERSRQQRGEGRSP